MKDTSKHDAVTLHILKQLENYKQLWPVLKLMQGEAFEKDHWRNLFQMLKLPRDVTIENLNLGHLLSND